MASTNEGTHMAKGWIAVVKAPTAQRKHREISADGTTEHDALVNLAAKLVAMGNPKTEGDIRTAKLDEV